MIRSLALFTGFVVAVAVVPPTWSQPSAQRPTLAERIGAIGRGLTAGGSRPSQPATANERSGGAAEATDQRSAFPQVDGQSLLPTNLFGRRTDRRYAAPRAGGPEVRRATRPLGDSEPDGEREGITLPGLGGSPFPAETPRDSAANGGDVAGGLGVEYSPVRSDDRYPADSGRQSLYPAATSGAAARQSPERRTVPHVDANDLRRELAGAFPPPSTTDDPSTAAGKPSSISDAAPDRSAGSVHSGRDADPDSVDTIMALPVNEDTGGVSAGARAGGPPFGARVDESPFGARAGEPSFGARSNQSPTFTRDSVLVRNQTPIITTDIRGPKQVLVGREATFRVRLANQGDAAAEGIVATVHIPSWADVLDTAASSGTVGATGSASASAAGTGSAGGTLLEWQLPRLEARASESLDVRLVPRTSRPLELGVQWTLAPVGSRVVVEVQEPKLDMHVSGPDEVLFGKPQLYRFTLSNPGTGVAENVKIELFPPGGGEQAVSSNPMGNLPPGESRTVEVELIARDAGKLSIKALASAAGGLATEATKDVFCRKPELSVDWRGPDMKYAGTDATYFFRVRNPGTAVAENVTIQAALPEGAKFISASEGQVYDAERNAVAWRVGSLGPGDDYYMELKCNLNAPGVNQLQVAATTAAGDLSDSKLAETNIVALADLKLEVSDPSGPVAVGEEAIYEIRVQNRGANTAREINVAALFSAGIEPDQVEGGAYDVVDGRVSFRTIDELPVGRQVVLRIRAHAVEPGTHLFRAEVLCRDLDIKLAAEETTRFYADDALSLGSDGESHQASNPSEGFESSTR